MDMAALRPRVPLAAAAMFLTPLAACSGDEGSTVDVTLEEFALSTSENSVRAGDVTFKATNEGPNDTHEFVILRSDLDPTQLPTEETGEVDENAEDLNVVDEIEDIPVGETESLTDSLDAGNYVLICNIYDEDEQESHYQEGMRTGFTVE